MHRIWISLGAFAGLAAVGMAAAAAHTFGALSPSMLRAADAGVQMQGWHALALLSCGLWSERHPGRLINVAGAAFTAGLLLFCGGVYALALAGLSLGGLVPAGGILLMVGWLSLGVSVWR